MINDKDNECRQSTLHYLLQMSEEMSAMAQKARMPSLALILDMARDEAQYALKQISADRTGDKNDSGFDKTTEKSQDCVDLRQDSAMGGSAKAAAKDSFAKTRATDIAKFKILSRSGCFTSFRQHRNRAAIVPNEIAREFQFQKTEIKA